MLKTQTKHAQLQASGAAAVKQPTGSAGSRAKTEARTAALPQAKAWGWLPELSLTSATGLLLLAFTNYGAYTAAEWATPLFWLGLSVLLLPPVYRLSSARAERNERIGLVILLVASFYAVKLMHSPFTFTFADEFVHAYNVEAALVSNHLFNPNSILRVTAFYPGLAAVTAAVADITGLPAIPSGVVLIGVARLVLVLAIFLLFEQVSGSTRVAGLGAALFMAQSNFLYWSAQYAYESLAFPLVLTVLFLAAKSQAARRRSSYWGYTLLAMLVIVAVVVTHHLSSYALALFLVAWSLLEHTQLHTRLAVGLDHLLAQSIDGLSQRAPYFGCLGRVLAREDLASKGDRAAVRRRAPDLLAIFAAATAVTWLLMVATPTISYLAPVLSQAVLSIVRVLTGEPTTRQLFVSDTGYVAPLWERLTGLGAVLLCAGGLPFGLYQIWRRYSGSAVVVLLAGAAVAYFFMLGFRFTGAGWETANRASAYLFLGLGLVLSIAAVRVWLARYAAWHGRLAVVMYIGIVFAGGVIAGWPGQHRLAQPYMVDIGDQAILPEGESAAAWVRDELPQGVFGADEANGRLLLSRANRIVLAGGHPFITELLTHPEFDQWQLQALHDYQMEYVIVDRRRSSWDNMVGYFFLPKPHGSERTAEWLKPEQYQKYNRRSEVDRLFDSGNIVIYDIGALNHEQLAEE